MRDDGLFDAVALALEKVRLAYPELERRSRISSRRDGYPARASGAQPGSVTIAYNPDREIMIGGISIDYADPTGACAAEGIDTPYKPDPVTRRKRTVDRCLQQMLRLAQTMEAQLVDPKDHDDNLAWCTACATVKNEDGRPFLTPPDSRIKGMSDVGGRLKEPTTLCRWHRDWVATTGTLPPRAITVEYVTKGRAPRRIA